MPFVERSDGVVVGIFANAQPGYAEEELSDDDAEVVAFLSPPPPPIDRTAALEAALIAKGIIADGDVDKQANSLTAAARAELAQIRQGSRLRDGSPPDADE